MTTHFKQLLPGIALLALSANVMAATIDTATKGTWIGAYGSNGYVLFDYSSAITGDGTYSGAAANVNDVASLPAFISSYTYENGAQHYRWASSTTDVRAVQDPSNPGGPRKSSTAFDGDAFDIAIQVAQAGTFKLSVYALDWDFFGNPNGRGISLDIDGADATVVDNGTANGSHNDGSSDNAYENGAWVNFNVSVPNPNSTIHVNAVGVTGGNFTLSALAFDNFTAIPEPASLGVLCLGGLLLGRRSR